MTHNRMVLFSLMLVLVAAVSGTPVKAQEQPAAGKSGALTPMQPKQFPVGVQWVLVSLNGDREGIAAQQDGCGAYLFVADVLAVDMAARIWSSAMCDDETCCPVEGRTFELVQP